MGDGIDAADLRPRHLHLDEAELHVTIGTSLEETARRLALKTFAFTGGDHAKTARILGIEERELRERLLSYVDVPVAAEG
jgi:DNA-binding NtrC family response regulator